MDIVIARRTGIDVQGRCVVKIGSGLSKADQKTWQQVARTVRPLSAAKLTTKTPTHIHLPPIPAPAVRRTLGDIQVRADKKVRRGQIQIETTIDLHDLTRDTAFAALKRRLLLAHECGHRTVLVITGKGPNLKGVLRQSLPTWLTDPSIRNIISSTAQAHIKHGGTGAVYVFLKRRRNP